MTFFNFKASKPSIGSNYTDGKHSERISISLLVSDDGQFDIGDEYLFASDRAFKRYGKEKKEVEAALTIQKTSSLAGSGIKLARRDNKDDAVGFAIFHKEHYSEAIYESFPAALYFEIFVNDELFNKIYSNITNKLFITQIRLEAEGKEGEVEFGWELDGSHKIWRPTEEHARLDLYNFGISFAQELEVDDETKEEVEVQKNALIAKLFKDINAIQMALYVIAFAAALEIAKRLFN